MHNKLIKIADALDAKGMHKDADFVDELIKSSGMLSRQVENFVKNLKGAFLNASYPLNEKDIMDIIDGVINKGDFRSMDASEKTFRQLRDLDIILAQELASAEDSVVELGHAISIEKDEGALRKLRHEISKEKETLNNIRSKIEVFRAGPRDEDKESFENIMRHYSDIRSGKQGR